MNNYPRYIGHPNFKPFNPIKLSKETEKIVCKGNQKKYGKIFFFSHIKGTSVRLYHIGCNLRCVFCLSNPLRDFPSTGGTFCTPADIIQKLASQLERQRILEKYFPAKRRFKIGVLNGGCEPTIGRKHLIELLTILDEKKFIEQVCIVTNGLLFGHDKTYVKKISEFKKLSIVISIKGAFTHTFQTRTGSIGRFYHLPFKAIKYCLDYDVHLDKIHYLGDTRFVSEKEIEALREKLSLVLPESREVETWNETIKPYPNAEFRLKKANVIINFTTNQRCAARTDIVKD